MQPLSLEAHATPDSDIAACRALLRNGSRTFYAASFLLPRHVREPASALYAFCRLADDAVDVEHGSIPAVQRLSERLEWAYCGTPLPHPADRAFAATVAKFDIPKALPEALLAGLEWDALGHRYKDLAEINAYAARVAGTVGTMMAVLMGVRSPELLSRACDLGIAMQLTNIARDVGEDARAGRIYLPLAWMRQAGIDPDAWLTQPKFTPALGCVVARLLDAADVLYERADAGIARLPASCRPGIRAARLLYSEIGHELRRNGLDSVSRRTVVPAKRKLKLLLRAMSDGAQLPSIATPCIEQAQFLVKAAASTDPAYVPTSALRWWNFRERAVWVIDLFEKLERHERKRFTPRNANEATA